MNAKHTPGPWTIQGSGTLAHPVTGSSLSTVRIETSLGTFEILDETNEPDQNVRLITAAPDLLAALELALVFLPDDAVSCGTMVRRAIAKATGTP